MPEAKLIVGVPKEIKPEEYRVAITPALIRELVTRGHQVLVERHAGEVSSMPDEDFIAAGASIAPEASGVFEAADLIVKVKEPQSSEVGMLRSNQLLFTFLHLAAYPELADGLLAKGVSAVAYETVQLASGKLPLLAPMSEIAGRMATQSGAHYLERPQGGPGVLIGGVPGVAPARVTVLGAGRAGTHATLIAAGMGADVAVMDLSTDRLRAIDEMRLPGVTTIQSSKSAVEDYVAGSDLVIGAVLMPGARAPVVVSEDLVQSMRPRSVVVDISIDQGGCIATAKETTHAEPVYEKHGVLHYAVGNIPGAVPNTATLALTNATTPYVLALAEGLPSALAAHPELGPGLNLAGGVMTNAAVAAAIGKSAASPEEALDS